MCLLRRRQWGSAGQCAGATTHRVRRWRIARFTAGAKPKGATVRVARTPRQIPSEALPKTYFKQAKIGGKGLFTKAFPICRNLTDCGLSYLPLPMKGGVCSPERHHYAGK